VGTATGNHLKLEDRTVSRYHLELAPADEGVRVRDVGSLNGTFLGAVRITDAVVPVGARVSLGDTTVEVLAKPILGRGKTHFVTGYVHKPYPPVYADLARHAGFDSALIIRGVEGGVMPSLRQAGRYFAYTDGGEERGFDTEPDLFGIDQPVRAVPIPPEVPQSALSLIHI